MQASADDGDLIALTTSKHCSTPQKSRWKNAEVHIQNPPSLNRLQLLAYALPAMPMAALTLPLYLIVPTFYAEAIGLPLAGIGIALLIVRIFDAVNDPLIGHLVDQWRGPLGQRKTWLAISVIPVVVAAFAMFYPPQSASLFYLTLAGIGLSVGYTAIVLPLSAWGAELSQDYHEKSRIVAWRESAVLIGTLIAIALPFTIGWDDPQSIHGLALLAIAIGLSLPLFSFLAIRFVPEPETEKQTKPSGILESFSVLRQNAHFLRLILAFLINSAANAMPATLFLLYVSQKLDAEDWRGPLLLLYFASAILGMPLWTYLSKRFGKNRTWCLAMITACLLFLPAAFIGPEQFNVFVFICIATGICLGADLVLPASMQADVIEIDRINHGKSRAAFFFSMWSLTTKLALALAVGIAFPLLSLFGLDADMPSKTTETGILALGLLYAIAPIVLKIAAIGMMWHFPLSEAKVAELKQNAEPKPAI